MYLLYSCCLVLYSRCSVLYSCCTHIVSCCSHVVAFFNRAVTYCTCLVLSCLVLCRITFVLHFYHIAFGKFPPGKLPPTPNKFLPVLGLGFGQGDNLPGGNFPREIFCTLSHLPYAQLIDSVISEGEFHIALYEILYTDFVNYIDQSI